MSTRPKAGLLYPFVEHPTCGTPIRPLSAHSWFKITPFLWKWRTLIKCARSLHSYKVYEVRENFPFFLLILRAMSVFSVSFVVFFRFILRSDWSLAPPCLFLFACLRQSLIVNAEDSFSLPEPELNAFVDKLFAFSFVWSIAGSVQEEG